MFTVFDKSMAKEAKKKSREENENHAGMVDPVMLGNILLDISQKARPLIQKYFENADFDFSPSHLDPMHINQAYAEFLGRVIDNPQHYAELQVKYWQDWVNLWQESAKRFMGDKAHQVVQPEKGDKRFRAPVWQESAIFDFIKQSYLLTSHWAEEVIHDTEGMNEKTKQKLEFATKQYMDALAPTNFLLTNPEVLQETIDTGGENLLRGLENLIEDLERGQGELQISTTKYEAFKLGKNIATTPGKVVYQNDLMQLIQYEAQTDEVFKRPLVIVPPWINKYYILDLRPENSFIDWLVKQGHTVFVISWVNPSHKLATKRFEDYMEEGVLAALEQTEKITGEKTHNIIGYCLGGTLLATTLAWMEKHNKANKVASATFLTTLVDFELAGDLKLFIDEDQVNALDKSMEKRGFLEADHLRRTFSLIRARDMIWSFVVNNYLMGREPFPFDLLYWNDDATNMPAAMHRFYIRKLYLENCLSKPGGVTMNGTPIDIGKIKTPAYFLSTKEDHIAPWKATYATTQLIGGHATFTLAASGHVAGVVNPPANNKYCYWSASKTPKDPEQWLDDAKHHDGSWWPHWQKWIRKYTGEKVKARKIGGSKLKPIENAPGKYVKMKAPD